VGHSPHEGCLPRLRPCALPPPRLHRPPGCSACANTCVCVCIPGMSAALTNARKTKNAGAQVAGNYALKLCAVLIFLCCRHGSASGPYIYSHLAPPEQARVFKMPQTPVFPTRSSNQKRWRAPRRLGASAEVLRCARGTRHSTLPRTCSSKSSSAAMSSEWSGLLGWASSMTSSPSTPPPRSARPRPWRGVLCCQAHRPWGPTGKRASAPGKAGFSALPVLVAALSTLGSSSSTAAFRGLLAHGPPPNAPRAHFLAARQENGRAPIFFANARTRVVNGRFLLEVLGPERRGARAAIVSRPRSSRFSCACFRARGH